jgi:hypothetical protein
MLDGSGAARTTERRLTSVDRLGDILELVYTATRRSKTVRATLREWWNEERLRAALIDEVPQEETARFPPEEDIPSPEGAGGIVSASSRSGPSSGRSSQRACAGRARWCSTGSTPSPR